MHHRGTKTPGVLLAILLIGLAGLSCRSFGQRGSIPMAFRYDDFSAKSDTQLEKQILALLDRYDIPCTVGVIPDVYPDNFAQTAPQDLVPLPQEKAAMLRDALATGTIEVAQHGYSHQLQNGDPSNPSEFVGLGYDAQHRRIADGKALLEQAIAGPVQTFIPPWNTYDADTVAAVQDLGFAGISAGLAGPEPTGANVAFLPTTCGLAGLERAVNANRVVAYQVPVVALFHAYDFRESNPQGGTIDLAEFERILAWAKGQSVLRIETLGQLAAERP